MIPALKNLPYKDRLKACNMSTLHYRQVVGDMIETYKILSGKYDTNMVPNLKTTGIQATQGNDLRIFKTRFKYDLRKFYFTNRVVPNMPSINGPPPALCRQNCHHRPGRCPANARQLQATSCPANGRWPDFSITKIT